MFDPSQVQGQQAGQQQQGVAQQGDQLSSFMQWLQQLLASMGPTPTMGNGQPIMPGGGQQAPSDGTGGGSIPGMSPGYMGMQSGQLPVGGALAPTSGHFDANALTPVMGGSMPGSPAALGGGPDAPTGNLVGWGDSDEGRRQQMPSQLLSPTPSPTPNQTAGGPSGTPSVNLLAGGPSTLAPAYGPQGNTQTPQIGAQQMNAAKANYFNTQGGMPTW